MTFPQLLKSWVLLALGVIIASATSAGIRYESEIGLAIAVLLLSLSNLFLRPVLMLFSLPFIVLTFGLGIWLINAVLFFLIGMLVEGFVVSTFGSALWGALVVSVTGAIANILFVGGKIKKSRVSFNVHRGQTGSGSTGPVRGSVVRKPLKDDSDVIDI